MTFVAFVYSLKRALRPVISFTLCMSILFHFKGNSSAVSIYVSHNNLVWTGIAYVKSVGYIIITQWNSFAIAIELSCLNTAIILKGDWALWRICLSAGYSGNGRPGCILDSKGLRGLVSVVICSINSILSVLGKCLLDIERIVFPSFFLYFAFLIPLASLAVTVLALP